MSTIDTIGRGERANRHRLQTALRLLPILVIGMFDRIAERHRSRVALLEINDEQLKDIGLTRADAWREGVRPFWD